jgi:hypothetical protein
MSTSGVTFFDMQVFGAELKKNARPEPLLIFDRGKSTWVRLSCTFFYVPSMP